MFNKALSLAKVAHAGQVDKGGNPYINHPIAVSEMLESEEEKTVAILHDIVEDTAITLDDLRKQGFPEHVVEAVQTLSKGKGIAYEDYIENVKKNKLALAVKIADMTHNSDLSRIQNPTAKDYARVEKYRRIMRGLKQHLSKIQ